MALLRAVVAGLTLSSIGFGLHPAISFGQPGPRKKSSFTDSIRNGFAKVADALTPEPTVVEAADPISLAVKPTTEPGLFVAMAYQTEQVGNLPETDALYQRALESGPENLDAIVSYARFNDRQGRFEEATKLYQRAAQLAPENPAVLNDLGICYARRNMLKEAAVALQGAIRMEPNRPLYHNNIATVYAGMGNSERALAHLKQVHDEPAAYYNLGYLLQRGGRTHEAARCFSEALARDPLMTEARIWLEKLDVQPPGVGSRPSLATTRRSLRPPSGPDRSAGPRLSVPPPVQTPLASAQTPPPSGPARPAMPSMSAPMPPMPRSLVPGAELGNEAETHPRVRPLPPVHRVDPPTPRAEPPMAAGKPPGNSPADQPSGATMPVVHPLPPVR